MKYIIPKIVEGGNESDERSSCGHSFYNWLTSYLISDLSPDIEFIHSPLKKSSKRFENILNLGKNFKNINDIKPSKTVTIKTFDFGNDGNVNYELFNKRVDNLMFIIGKEPDNTLFIMGDASQFPGLMVEKSEHISDILSECYINPHKYGYDNNYTNVAIHIRRGDINKEKHQTRWEENDHYISIIKEINEKIKNVKFHIFSEGVIGDFQEFNDYNCNIILNGSDLLTLDGFVKSDILVTGQSTFSTMVAYMNKGIIIYTPCVNYSRFEKFSKRFIKYNEIKEKLWI
jgi:hypothetical protein